MSYAARRLVRGAITNRFLCAALAALAVGVCAPAAASAADVAYSPTDGSSFFSPSSFWNTPLPSDAQITGNSKTLVNTLQQAATLSVPWINTTSYSVPVYKVPAGQPLVGVVLDANSPSLQNDFLQVPIPSNAVPAAGDDEHLMVYQQSSDTMWEFWGMRVGADGNWHARWGGKMTSVSTNPGYFQNPYGATATSLPLIGGLMTIQEQANRQINHAIAFAMPHAKANSYVWPAQRSDGDNTSSNAVPEGTRFRLPASLNIDAMNLLPETAMIAKAVQKYGMVLRDQAGSVVFYGEDPNLFEAANGGWNPYGYLFGATSPALVMQQFPWSKLQAIAAKTP